jgi:hypothetical protein
MANKTATLTEGLYNHRKNCRGGFTFNLMCGNVLMKNPLNNLTDVVDIIHEQLTDVVDIIQELPVLTDDVDIIQELLTDVVDIIQEQLTDVVDIIQ